MTASHVRTPRFRLGLLIAPSADGLLIEGGPSRQLLSGQAATTLIPRLVPLLDGLSSPELLSERLGIDEHTVHQAIALFEKRALLEWIRPDRLAEDAADEVTTYLSRTMAVCDRHPSAGDLLDDLGTAAIAVVAPDPVAAAITEDLLELGVGTVTRYTLAELAEIQPERDSRRMVAVFDDPAARQCLDQAAWLCRERDLPMLRFGADGDILEVGPVFYGDDTACVRCFRHAMTPDAEQPARDRAGLSADGTTDLLASMVSARLLATLTSQAHPKAPRIITRVDLRGNIPSIREVTPDLTCSLCSGGTPPADEESRDVLAYDWRVKRWSDRLEPQLTLSPAENVRIAALQRERMSTLHTAPRKKLPPPEPAAAPMSESVIADLLCRSVGFRSPGDAPPAYARWAPSGGNLASPAAYIITHPDIFGIPGSVFRYEDMSHELVAVHNDTVSIAEFLADTDLTARDADSAVVVLVAAVGRLRRKYGDFSWRLAHLDAGCAALQLALIAESHGFSAIFASHWPVTIADVLDLDPQQEVVTAIAGISTTPRLSGE